MQFKEIKTRKGIKRAPLVETEATNKIVNVEQEENVIDYLGVLPTTFNTQIDVIAKELTEDLEIGDEYKLIKKVLKNKNFALYEVDLEDVRVKVSSTASKIIGYIVKYVDFNVNYIYFTYNNVNAYAHIDNNAYAKAISELVTHNVIQITNRRSLYIVNHNYIFKGNIIRFIDKYNKKYNGELASLNEKGEIILKD